MYNLYSYFKRNNPSITELTGLPKLKDLELTQDSIKVMGSIIQWSEIEGCEFKEYDSLKGVMKSQKLISRNDQTIFTLIVKLHNNSEISLKLPWRQGRLLKQIIEGAILIHFNWERRTTAGTKNFKSFCKTCDIRKPSWKTMKCQVCQDDLIPII